MQEVYKLRINIYYNYKALSNSQHVSNVELILARESLMCKAVPKLLYIKQSENKKVTDKSVLELLITATVSSGRHL